jgi:hypothetical protein
MNKRDFIRTSVMAGVGLMSFNRVNASAKPKKSAGFKHWVWENPNHKEEENAI